MAVSFHTQFTAHLTDTVHVIQYTGAVLNYILDEVYCPAVVQHCTCILYNMNCMCEVCSELCMINDSHMYTIVVLIYPGVSHTSVSFSGLPQHTNSIPLYST